MSYGKITSRYWTGTTGRLMRRESPWVRVISIYLMTCPWKSMTGLYYLPIPILVHEVGCTRAEAIHALTRLRALDFSFYDPEHELVWVVNMAREQVGEALQGQDKRVVFVQRLVRPYLHTRLGRAWLERYGRDFQCAPLLREIQRPGRDPGAGAAAAAGDDLDELEQLALEGDEPPGLDELAESLARPGRAQGLELEPDPGAGAAAAAGDDLKASQIAARAVQTLSAATGRKFKVTQPVKDDIAKLVARFTERDIEDVIRVKAQQWRGDARMAQHLTPRVLFAPEKFERYLEEDVRAGPVLTPEEAWAVVSKEMVRCGGKWGHPQLDPLLMAAVKRAGWGNLCMASSRDAPRIFMAAFRSVMVDTSAATLPPDGRIQPRQPG